MRYLLQTSINFNQLPYFKKLSPDSRIIAFEANPHAFRLLEDNIKINKIRSGEIHNVALYDKEKEVSFFIGDNIGTLLGSIKNERGGDTELKIKGQKYLII
jgi:FkbM family methyltransferase